MSDPRERYDHNANNVTGTPVDEENDLVPIQLWREQQAEIERLRAEIERLRALLDGYEAMEKSMKQEASG